MKHTRKKSNDMKRHMLLLPVFLVAVVALILGAAVPDSWASGWGWGDPEEFEVAELYFELNDTDEDLGIHGKIDGGPWKSIWIKDPSYRSMMKVTARGRLRQQAVTELFFESAEPTFDDLDPADFFDRFPEGYYRIYGWSEENKLLKGKSLIRHVMPAPPGNIMISGHEGAINHKDVDCESDTLPEVELGEDDDVTISWAPVTGSHPDIGEDGDIEAALYQLVVEMEVDGEDFESVFSVDLPPTVTEMTIPRAYIDLGLDEEGEGEFKFEILVKEEEGGNQTAAESCFAVVPPEEPE